MRAIQSWKLAPLRAPTTVEAVFELTFEDSPKERVHSNLWRDSGPSEDDAVIFDVSCNGGMISLRRIVRKLPSCLRACMVDF